MNKKPLKTYDLSDEIFDKILYDYKVKVVIEPLNQWICGYGKLRDKNIITYNGKNEMIWKEYLLNGYCHNIEACTPWKQCRIRKVENAKTQVSESLTGSMAWSYVYHQILEKQYTKEEIDSILKSHKKDGPRIHNYLWNIPINKITKIEHCYYYDINSAYMSALVELFPKCEDNFKKMYDKRKKKPIYKQYANYFCGMLTRKGYRETFNWITHRTHDIVDKMLDELKGRLLYVKTDGFFITCPENTVNSDLTLGKFKLELTDGDVYFYKDINYWIMQYTNDKGELESKGSCRKAVRDDIDLKNNVVVHYSVQHDKELNLMQITNITKETINNGN